MTVVSMDDVSAVPPQRPREREVDTVGAEEECECPLCYECMPAGRLEAHIGNTPDDASCEVKQDYCPNCRERMAEWEIVFHMNGEASCEPPDFSDDEEAITDTESDSGELSPPRGESEMARETNEFESLVNRLAGRSRADPGCNSSRFEPQDLVIVRKRGHKRHGARGIVERCTDCYVFFREVDSGDRIKIMHSSLALVGIAHEAPGHLEHVERRADDDIVRSSVFGAAERPLRTAPSLPPPAKPTDIPIGAFVKVLPTHRRHGGREGKVQRHTKCFLVVRFSNARATSSCSTSVWCSCGRCEDARISPKFVSRVR